jgi:transcriptional regulator with XRE-family HTH domain
LNFFSEFFKNVLILLNFRDIIYVKKSKEGIAMYEERKSNCAERISAALQIRQMKQADLCLRTNIPKSAMSQYVSGAFEPKQDRIYLISKALNVSEAWLMGYDVPMERQEKTVERDSLTASEKEWLDLFRSVPQKSQPLLIETFRTFNKIPEDRQEEALELLEVALRMQKKS